MATFTSPFTGNVVQPTDVSYKSLNVDNNQTIDLSWPAATVPGGFTQATARIMDFSGNGGGTIVLPPPSQGSVGSDILVNNFCANAIVVELFGIPESSTSLPPGQSSYFYLVNNEDENPDAWNVIGFGSTLTQADAMALAGYGLQSQEGKLNTTTVVNELYSDYTFTAIDRASAFVWKEGLGTLTLPSPGSITEGWFILLRNEGSGQIDVQAPYLKTINGFSSQVFFPTDSAIITFDNTTGNFYTIGLPRATLVPYSSAIYDVDSLPGNTLNLVNAAVTIQTYVANTGTRTQSLAVTLPAITQIYVITNQTNQTGYSVTFQVTGSPDAPVIISNGTVAILLTYGLKIQILYGNNNLLQIDGGTF